MGKRGPVAKYVVRLSSDERDRLEGLIRTGREASYRLLKADVSSDGPGWDDARISEALETCASTVFRTRRQLVEEGREWPWRARSARRHRPGYSMGWLMACSEPPEGHACWSLRLLEKRVVELGIVDAASGCSKKPTQTAPKPLFVTWHLIWFFFKVCD